MKVQCFAESAEFILYSFLAKSVLFCFYFPTHQFLIMYQLLKSFAVQVVYFTIPRD